MLPGFESINYKQRLDNLNCFCWIIETEGRMVFAGVLRLKGE